MRRKDEKLNDGTDVSPSGTVGIDKESASGPQFNEHSQSAKDKRHAHKQPGAKGFWRSQRLVSEKPPPHYPALCEYCKAVKAVMEDVEAAKPYMGHHVLELEKTGQEVRISCSLHYSHAAVCVSGQETKARPGEGFVSHLEGRKTDLKVTEYVLVGPSLGPLWQPCRIVSECHGRRSCSTYRNDIGLCLFSDKEMSAPANG